MITNIKKKIAIALSVMLFVTMCFAEIGFAADESSINPYEPPKDPDDVMLEIYCGDTKEAVKTYTREDISNMDCVTHTYSYYNSYPTPTIASESGIEIEKLLKEAGVWEGIEDDQLIRFVGSDNVDFSMTKEKLFAPRYCYPNGILPEFLNGEIEPEGAREGAVQVPPIIDVGNKDSEGIVVFGQLYPGEQNKSRFCKKVAHCNKVRVNNGTAEEPDYQWIQTASGKIIIEDKLATEAPVIECKTKLPAGAKLPIGTKIEFEAPIDNRGHWQFYTLDGSEPKAPIEAPQQGEGSYLYNYSEYLGLTRDITVQPGTNTIKIMNFSYDYLDSPVATYTFQGIPKEQYMAIPNIKKLSPGKKKIKVYWTKVSGAKGYKLYRATSLNGSYKCIRTIKSYKTTSYTSRSLKKGRTYYYKVRAYKVVKKKTYYSTYTPVRSAKAK